VIKCGAGSKTLRFAAARDLVVGIVPRARPRPRSVRFSKTISEGHPPLGFSAPPLTHPRDNLAKDLPCRGKHYAIVPSEPAHLLPILPISCRHIFPDRPLSEASRTGADLQRAAFTNDLCACGMAGDSTGAPSPAICMIRQRTTTINDDGGGDGGDDDDGGPALGWPLPERQRLRIRRSIFAVVSWGSHLLNTEVSRTEIRVSEGARCRAIQISGKSRFQAQTARSSNANREKYFCQWSYSTDDKFGISLAALGRERRMREAISPLSFPPPAPLPKGSPLSFPPPAPLLEGSELSLGKTGRGPLNLHSRE
jgi:hypothetical protein